MMRRGKGGRQNKLTVLETSLALAVLLSGIVVGFAFDQKEGRATTTPTADNALTVKLD